MAERTVDKKEIKMSKVLSDSQEEKLITRLATGQEVFSEDDALRVLNWASETVVNMALLDMVLAGNLVLLVKDEEVNFRKIDS